VEHLGGHPDGPLQLQILILGTLHQIADHCSYHNREDHVSANSIEPNAADTKEMKSASGAGNGGRSYLSRGS
jgi:hypothetical protein